MFLKIAHLFPHNPIHRNWVELMVVIGLLTLTIQLIIGSPLALLQIITIPLLIVIIISTQITSKRTLVDQGLQPTLWLKPIIIVGFTSFIVAALLLFIGYWLGSIHLWGRDYLLFLIYPVWALAQHYLLNAYIIPRLSAFPIPFPLVALIGAGVFGLTHFPNYFLVLVTFVAGYFWIWAYQKWNNLYVISLSHGWLAALTKHTLPAEMTLNFKIGGLLWWH